MTRTNKKQPTDKKPLLANKKLWREIPDGLQGKVRGGQNICREETVGCGLHNG